MLSVLNYTGSRYKWIYEFVSSTVSKEDTYIEPFGGGFSLGLNLLYNDVIDNAVYNDAEKELVNYWNINKNNWLALVDAVDKVLIHNDNIDDKTDDVSLAAKYWLYNHKKSNKLKDSFEYTDSVVKANRLLQNVEILNCDYRELKKIDSESTYWSLDPPYKIKNASKYYKYIRENRFNHEEFKEFVDSLKGKIVLTYNDSSEIREMYKDYNIEEIYKDNTDYHELLITKNI